MLKILFTIIQFAFVFYFILILFLYFMQTRMIFIPYKEVAGTPSDIGLEFEEINLRSRNGAIINGWFIPAENAEYTILFCHGNAGNISHRLDTISIFNRLPANFLFSTIRLTAKAEAVFQRKTCMEMLPPRGTI